MQLGWPALMRYHFNACVCLRGFPALVYDCLRIPIHHVCHTVQDDVCYKETRWLGVRLSCD